MNLSRIQMLTYQTPSVSLPADGSDSSAARALQTFTLSFISAIACVGPSPSQSYVTFAYIAAIPVLGKHSGPKRYAPVESFVR